MQTKTILTVKLSRTEILDINRIWYNCGEMAETTYPQFH